MAEDPAPGRPAPDSDRRPAGIDTSVAHPARVYDYWLGGKDNFAADREAAEQVIAARPTAPGSYLVISQPASDVHADLAAEGARRYNERVATKQTRRSRAEVARFVEGLEVVEPGVVQMHRWRPEPGANVDGYEVSGWAVVARKPQPGAEEAN